MSLNIPNQITQWSLEIWWGLHSHDGNLFSVANSICSMQYFPTFLWFLFRTTQNCASKIWDGCKAVSHLSDVEFNNTKNLRIWVSSVVVCTYSMLINWMLGRQNIRLAFSIFFKSTVRSCQVDKFSCGSKLPHGGTSLHNISASTVFWCPLCSSVSQAELGVRGDGGTGVKWSASAHSSHWKGHCLPWNSWQTVILFEEPSESPGAGGSLLSRESTSSDSTTLDQCAGVQV